MSKNWTDSIVAQLAEITATSQDGEHLLEIEHVLIVHNSSETTPAQHASAYLHTGEWDVRHHPCAGMPGCVRPDHVSPVQMTEEMEDQLVSRATRPSLATLYKRARDKGLVPASPSGYF